MTSPPITAGYEGKLGSRPLGVPACDAASGAAGRLRVLDLFSGIGGFSLGLERAGFATAAFCEIDPAASRVLADRWPNVPNLGDVTKAEFPHADIITAGFPCQDISKAGDRAGLAGEHSGLFREVVRAVRVVRPSYVLLENVADLVVRGLGTVAGELATIGHDAEWDCVPAAAVSSPQLRDRIWIVAYPARERDRLAESSLPARWDKPEHRAWWASEPAVGRVVDELSAEPHRIGVLGNAVVPAIPEIIGRSILAAEAASRLERAA